MFPQALADLQALQSVFSEFLPSKIMFPSRKTEEKGLTCHISAIGAWREEVDRQATALKQRAFASCIAWRWPKLRQALGHWSDFRLAPCSLPPGAGPLELVPPGDTLSSAWRQSSICSYLIFLIFLLLFRDTHLAGLAEQSFLSINRHKKWD